MIRVSHTSIGGIEPKLLQDFFQKKLPHSLFNKALKYRKQNDVLRFLCGKYLLQKLLVSHGFDKALLHQIKTQSGRKPYISPAFDFNISHSGNIVVCAFSTTCKVGIDIEQLSPVDPLKFKKVLSDSELKTIISSEDAVAYFFHIWTQKESVMKATGEGFKISPKEIKVNGNVAELKESDEFWYVYPVAVNTNYVCHLCSSQKDSLMEIDEEALGLENKNG